MSTRRSHQSPRRHRSPPRTRDLARSKRRLFVDDHYRDIAIVVAFVAIGLATDFIFVPTSWPPLLLLFLFLLWLALLDGVLVVPPPPSERNTRSKVFCIGLSRTGTTSITVALQQLGYHAHHQCCDLVKLGKKPAVVPYWAEAFDATSDVAPATVLEELASLYPDARFVLTQRDPRRWGEAMVRFCTQNAFIFKVPIPPVKAIFDAIYGAGWEEYTPAAWADVYAAHERRVDACFASQPDRLLRLNITGGEGWPELTSFLAETEKGSADAVADAEAAAAVAHARPEELGPFPHADVFWLSAVTQAGWQLQRLWRAGRRAVGVVVVLLVLLRPAFADHGQCRRACAVANGAGMPEVHGMTGHWFHHGIDGRRGVTPPLQETASSLTKSTAKSRSFHTNTLTTDRSGEH